MKKVYDLHHLIPRSHGGTNTANNIVSVTQSLHRAWHLLFYNWLPPRIAAELNKTWISKQWRMVAFEKSTVNKSKKLVILYEDSECKVYLKEKK